MSISQKLLNLLPKDKMAGVILNQVMPGIISGWNSLKLKYPLVEGEAVLSANLMDNDGEMIVLITTADHEGKTMRRIEHFKLTNLIAQLAGSVNQTQPQIEDLKIDDPKALPNKES